MSIYSGKCDVADHLSDATDEYLQNANIYIGDNIIPLRINNQHDLAPYYPYIIWFGGWGDGKAELHISTESYIDTNERDHLTWKLNDAKRYWRRCRRKKITYNANEAAQSISFLQEPGDLEREIARRVEADGDKATIEGLHDEIHEYYRKELLKEMLRLGWDKRRARLWIWKDWSVIEEEEDDK